MEEVKGVGIRRPLVRRTPGLLHRLCINACGLTTDSEDGIGATVHWCGCFTAFTDVNALVNTVLVISRRSACVDALTM
jgi:hypothetical protein